MRTRGVASVKPAEPVVGCRGKQSLPTMAMAERAAQAVRRRRHEHVAPYRCQHCHQFHVGGTDERGEMHRQKTYKRQLAQLKQQGVEDA